MFQRRDSRLTLFMLGLAWILGCGGSTKPPVPIVAPVPNQSPAPVPVAAQAAPAGGPVDDSVSASTSKAKPAKGKSAHFPGVDPKSIFVVDQTGESMDVVATKPQLATDEFEVVVASTEFDSSAFVVGDINPSAVAEPLIGTGKPKSSFHLPKGFVVVTEWGYNNEGLPLRIRCEKTNSILAVVPAGPSFFGTDSGPDESKPSVKLRLETFYMEIVEVTVKDYENFRSESRDKKKGTVTPAASNANGPDMMPALGITMAGASAYARWAGMELPTEAEFEKAARGPTGLKAPWGNGKPLWSDRTLTTVGSSAADRSPYGIFDLAGNAKEWCTDLYSPAGHKEAVAAAAKEALHSWPGPKQVPNMNLRVVKGNGHEWSSWNREGKDGGKSDRDIGFRCILRIPTDSKSS